MDSNLNLSSNDKDFQAPKQKQSDIYSVELLQCPIHSGYGVEVFCPKEGQEPCLLCVKCILDPIISQEIKGVRLIAVRDILAKSIEKTILSGSYNPNAEKIENLKQRYLEFNSRGYLEIFQRHVDKQMDKLDKEIDRIKGSIQKFRGSFSEFFEKRSDYLRKQDSNLRSLVTSYVEDKNEMERVSYNSLDALLHELSSISNFKDYEKFVKILFRKSVYVDPHLDDIETTKIFDAMDRMKVLVSTMKNLKVDIRILEDLRRKIESINILDKSIVLADLTALDPSLQTTIDKIRRVDKNPENIDLETARPNHSSYKSNRGSNRSSPADGIIRKRPTVFEEIFKPKTAYEKGQISMLKTPPSIIKYLQKGIGSESHSKRYNSKEFCNPVSSNEAIINLHNILESAYNPLCNSFWHESNPQTNLQQSNYQKMNNSSSGKKGLELQQIRDFNSFALADGSNSMGYRTSYYEELRKQREMNAKFLEKATDNYSMSENYIRSGNKACLSLENSKEHDKKSRITTQAFETLIEDLIDENLNGFVVFQNTIKDSTMNDTDDLSQNIDEKWIQLPRSERDEYIAIALIARVRIKEELKRQNISDLLQLKELIDQRIKEVKK